ncbi:MAG: nitrous oxide-stimulated promoter family protein [Bacteroidales bacterium]|nr:nitrous oxide-stimulated promoter family protein [Bacteroidales bacterium]
MNRIEEEKQVVRWMIGLFCRKKHNGKNLCPDCSALASYCNSRLEHCRFGNDKPTCKNCPTHCYRPDMREKIRIVMRYSGPRMIFYHPVAAIRHLLRR